MNHAKPSREALEALVVGLESVRLEVDDEALETLGDALDQRQRILDQIQEADASALCPESRRRLRERLIAVRAQDVVVLEALVLRHAEIAEALGESARARTAARGYRSAVEPLETGRRRTA